VTTYICSIGSYFILLDAFERSPEPYASRRVIVIFEEELERTGGHPDFWVFHREGRFWASAQTFGEYLGRKRKLGKSPERTQVRGSLR
jgi:hypothetical protein